MDSDMSLDGSTNSSLDEEYEPLIIHDNDNNSVSLSSTSSSSSSDTHESSDESSSSSRSLEDGIWISTYMVDIMFEIPWRFRDMLKDIIKMDKGCQDADDLLHDLINISYMNKCYSEKEVLDFMKYLVNHEGASATVNGSLALKKIALQLGPKGIDIVWPKFEIKNMTDYNQCRSINSALNAFHSDLLRADYVYSKSLHHLLNLAPIKPIGHPEQKYITVDNVRRDNVQRITYPYLPRYIVKTKLQFTKLWLWEWDYRINLIIPLLKLFDEISLIGIIIEYLFVPWTGINREFQHLVQSINESLIKLRSKKRSVVQSVVHPVTLGVEKKTVKKQKIKNE